MSKEDTQHAAAVRGYSTSLLRSIQRDLMTTPANDPRDHEQRWIIKRRQAVTAELQRRN